MPFDPAMDHFIVYAYPVLIETLLAACAILFACNLPGMIVELRASSARSDSAALAAIVVVAGALRFLVVPHTHHLLYDEIEHLNLASNLARLNAYGITMVGGAGDFDVLKAPPYWPAGFHVILGLAFRAFGYSEPVAFALNSALGVLGVLAVYAAGRMLFDDARGALASALLLALLPVHLKYSGAVELSICSALWNTSLFLCFFYHLRRPGTASLTLLAAVSAYAMNCRPENGIWPAAIFSFLVARNRATTAQSLLVALTTLPILVLVWANRGTVVHVFGGSPTELAAHFTANAPGNLRYLFDPFSPQAVLIPFALWGVRDALRRVPPAGYALIAGFCALFVVFSCFWMGDMSAAWLSSRPDRYGLALQLPVILAAGRGLSLASRRAKRGVVVLAASTAVFVLLCAPSYARISDEVDDQQARYRFLRDAAKSLPRDVYIVSYSPAAVTSIMLRPSVSSFLLLEDKASFERTLKAQGRKRELILFQDLWWETFKADSTRLETLLRGDYTFETIMSRDIDGSIFAFYRLTPKPDRS